MVLGRQHEQRGGGGRRRGKGRGGRFLDQVFYSLLGRQGPPALARRRASGMHGLEGSAQGVHGRAPLHQRGGRGGGEGGRDERPRSTPRHQDTAAATAAAPEAAAGRAHGLGRGRGQGAFGGVAPKHFAEPMICLLPRSPLATDPRSPTLAVFHTQTRRPPSYAGMQVGGWVSFLWLCCGGRVACA